MLIGDLLDRGLRATPNALAATLGGEHRTFADLDAATARAEGALRAHGVTRGDRVAWLANPSLDVLSGMLATARAGAVFAPVNPRLTDDETARTLDLLRPRVTVTDAHHRSRVDTPVLTSDRLAACPATVGSRDARVHADDPHIAYLTSGSTGRPKAALVSHRASWLRAAPGGGTFATTLRGHGGVVCTFPLYHYGGWHYVMEAWLSMSAVHLVPAATAESIVDTVERRRPSALYCIPAVWDRLLDDAFADADLSSLRHCDTGTSPVTADLIARIKHRVPGSTTSVLYGSTEAGRMAALADWELADHPGSVGRPAFPGSLWVDESGEVCVRTPAAMLGYLDDPDATRAVLCDGVYRSGDLGVLDEQGYLRLTGRRSEMIRTGGEYVAPAEVERALAGHPGIVDLAVVGVPDDRWGEVVCAAVVPDAGAEVDLESVRSYVDGRLAPHKRPRRIAIVDHIPRTPATGQIRRAVLRERVLAGPRTDRPEGK